MTMEMKVELTVEEEKKLLERAKDEVRAELTDEAVLNYIKNVNHLPVIELLRTFELFNKAVALDDASVKSLSRNDKMILVLKWLVYDKLI